MSDNPKNPIFIQQRQLNRVAQLIRERQNESALVEIEGIQASLTHIRREIAEEGGGLVKALEGCSESQMFLVKAMSEATLLMKECFEIADAAIKDSDATDWKIALRGIRARIYVAMGGEIGEKLRDLIKEKGHDPIELLNAMKQAVEEHFANDDEFKPKNRFTGDTPDPE